MPLEINPKLNEFLSDYGSYPDMFHVKLHIENGNKYDAIYFWDGHGFKKGRYDTSSYFKDRIIFENDYLDESTLLHIYALGGPSIILYAVPREKYISDFSIKSITYFKD